MNILFIASEVAPFAKTGGLADVAGAMPKHLAEFGHKVHLVMPLYRIVKESFPGLRPTERSITVPVGQTDWHATIWTSKLPDSDVPICFLDQPCLYDREELYGTYKTAGVEKGDYSDNCTRFTFLARGALEAAIALGLSPDVVHANDWQTGLVPVYIKTLYRAHPALANTGTVFTVHNLAYQGLFDRLDMTLTGLDWSLFNWRELEFFGKLNLLKGGLVFADIINTVSSQYAKEIQTPDFGFGLDGVLRERSADLFGIINGIDHSVWSPEVDELIPAKYGPDRPVGKATCKKELQRQSKLDIKSSPLLGMISRLDNQKGFDILALVVNKILQHDVQFVLLGTGDKKYHELFEGLARRYPGKVGIHLTFNNQLAHQIEAGADIFLMPSRYEPCGLNQLYSLRYGTVPVVRRTGGLADTIVDVNENTLASGAANGFSFDEYSGPALLKAVERALELYKNRKAWKQLMLNGMRQDWSWSRSAGEYAKLYQLAVLKRSQRNSAKSTGTPTKA